MSQQPTDEALLAFLSGETDAPEFDPKNPEVSARLENWQSLIEDFEAAGATEQAANAHTLSEFAQERIKSACVPKLPQQGPGQWKGRVISFLAGAAAVFVAGSVVLVERQADTKLMVMDAPRPNEIMGSGDPDDTFGSPPELDYDQQMRVLYEIDRLEQVKERSLDYQSAPSRERPMDSLSAIPKVTKESSHAVSRLDTSLIPTLRFMDLPRLGYPTDTWLELTVEEFRQVRNTMTAIKAAIDDSDEAIASYNKAMSRGQGSRELLALRESLSTASEMIVAVLHRFTSTPEFGAGNAQALIEHQQSAEKALEIWRKDFDLTMKLLQANLSATSP